jgi:hypothetical protein
MSDLFTLLVAGSRYATGRLTVWRAIDEYARPRDWRIVLRWGECPDGVDRLVGEYAEYYADRGLVADPMAADWDHCAPSCPNGPGHRRFKREGDTAHPGLLDDYCPGAGPRRNKAMVAKRPVADQMIGLTLGASYGTRGCMRLAKAAGITVTEIGVTR